MKLEQAIKLLYQNEINCGFETFWDGGFDAWIGNRVNGIKVQANFDIEQMDEAGAWLLEEARKLYPKLDMKAKPDKDWRKFRDVHHRGKFEQ